jgi:hypothetical protein
MDMSFARARAASRARVRRPESDASFPGQALLRIDTEGLMEHTRPRGCELREAVRLLDGYGRLKAMYATIQAAVGAAISGDEIVIVPGVYAEDLHINARLTLTCAIERSGSERAAGKAVVVGHVTVAAAAVELVVDGVAIEGGLTMQSAGGATASITLRSSGIQGSGISCARLSWLPHVRD